MSSEGSGESASGESAKAGWPAVSRLLRYGLGVLERGEQPPPLPEALYEWTDAMVPGVAVGALVGAHKHWEARSRAPQPPFPPPRTLSWELRRLFRFLDSAQRGVLSVGGLAALYFGVELLAGVYRGERWLVTDSFLGGIAAAGAYTVHAVTQTPTWPPRHLQQKLTVILMVAFGEGLWKRGRIEAKEIEAAQAAAAEKERLRQEMVAARQGSDAVSLLLAQLEAQRQGGAPAGVTAAETSAQEEQAQQAAQQGQGRQQEQPQQGQQQPQQQQQRQRLGDIEPSLEAAPPGVAPAGQPKQGWWLWR